MISCSGHLISNFPEQRFHRIRIFNSDEPVVEGLADEPKNVVQKKVNGWNKKFIKGERLKYYLTGMPLFSASRGMKRPIVEKISNKGERTLYSKFVTKGVGFYENFSTFRFFIQQVKKVQFIRGSHNGARA